jgi:hypothetical protein
LKTKEYIATTENLTLTNFFTCEEIITFNQQDNHTLFTSKARVTAVGFASFGSLIEKACVSRFETNAQVGRLTIFFKLDKDY